MAQNASYGMGQYRYDENFEYYTLLETITDNDNKIIYIDYSPKNDDVIYRDVAIKLPCDSEEKSLIKYGEVYYIKLKLPKNSIYNTNFNLKLCTANNDGKINTNKFQQIQYLALSSTNSNDNYSTVVLFEYENAVIANIPRNYVEGQATANQLYIKDNEYGYCILSESNTNKGWNTTYFSFITENYTEYNLLQDWKANNSSESSDDNNFDNFDFIFSPKYNLSEDYKYLWIENIHTNDEYVKTSIANQIYTGNMIVKDDIECSIYKVANLLAKDQYGIAPIKSGTTNLNAITAIGPAGLILAINGEDIRIGTSGQYQLEDFDINFLGAILGEDFEDKFTIDYTYTIES